MKPGAPVGFSQSILICVGLLTVAWACGDPEAIHLGEAGSTSASGGQTGSTGGAAPLTGGSPGSGGVIGSGGKTSTGGAGSGGRPGTGGSATGGAASGGMGTGGSATGGAASGGRTGTGGRSPGSGGANGGAAGMATTGGRAGTGGSGVGGTVGASTGTGPCMGLCASPISLTPGKSSGALGVAATCHEVLGSLAGLNCGNFVSPRTFSVNGAAVDCVKGGNFAPPAAKNGGYCMQASAGDYSYAYFTTY